MSPPRVVASAPVLVVALGGGMAVACGIKGPPMAPIVAVPDRVPSLRAERYDDRVYLRFEIPEASTDPEADVDVAQVEVYGLTTDPDRQPVTTPSLDDWLEAATLVATIPVRAPRPDAEVGSSEDADNGESGRDDEADDVPDDAVAPGDMVTIVEHLTAAHAAPVDVGEFEDEPDEVEEPARPGPLLGPPLPRPPRRTYLARAVSSRGREGAPSARVPVTLGESSPAPGPPVVTYTASAIEIEWEPAVGARLPIQETTRNGRLSSTPIVEVPEPSTYLVYRFLPDAPDVVTLPSALNAPGPPSLPASAGSSSAARPASVRSTSASPTSASLPASPPGTTSAFTLGGPDGTHTPPAPSPVVVVTSYSDAPVTYGVARCFVVRTRTVVDALPVLGPASPPTCIVPVDTFAPAPPRGVIAVAGAGAISLVWDENPERDVAGYRVLRRTAAGATLEPLTTELVDATSYRDAAVTPGETYTYVVQAVDNAVPANVSDVSREVSERAR